MKKASPPFYRGKRRVESDFVDGNQWLLEMMRTKHGEFTLVRYANRGNPAEYAKPFLNDTYAYFPLEEDEITRHVLFPQRVAWYRSASSLLGEVDGFLANCLDLDERHRFLLACFVLSTWLVDRLPVAPYVAFVGLPRSGKSTALHALYLLCRHGLMTSDISSAALYRACERLTPTLCIDETATAGQKRTLFHLLRSGTSRNAVAFREGHSYRSYSAKVFVWTEMPDDDALNSRCIVIPMQETSRTGLLRTMDPKVIEAAEALQAKLLVFRLFNYRGLDLPPIPGTEQLRSRDRDLYEALALPIGEDRRSCARLLECLKQQQNLDREPLPADKIAVLETLFRQIHIQPDRESFALRALKSQVNLALGSAGERCRLNEKAVSGVLRTLGFYRRKRTSAGYVVVIDRASRKHTHELLRTYGVESLSACLPPTLDQACEFCQPETPTDEESIPIPAQASAPAHSGANGREPGEDGEWQNTDEHDPERNSFEGLSEDELDEVYVSFLSDDGGVSRRSIIADLKWQKVNGPAFVYAQPPQDQVERTMPPSDDDGEHG